MNDIILDSPQQMCMEKHSSDLEIKFDKCIMKWRKIFNELKLRGKRKNNICHDKLLY